MSDFSLPSDEARAAPPPDPDAARGAPDGPQSAADRDRERRRALVTEVHDFLKLVERAEGPQRAREIDDLQFDRGLPEDHWPAGARKERQGFTDSDGTVVPERPCLTIPKLSGKVQQAMAEARGAKLAILIQPKGNGASREDAEVRQGLIRAIEVDSGAAGIRFGALERAMKCGRGYYLIAKVHTHETPTEDAAEFDQDLVPQEIPNQHAVYMDPFVKRLDAADAQRCLITEDFTEADYKARWGTSDLAQASDLSLSALGDQVPAWVSGDEGARIYRTGSYFYVRETVRTRVFLHGVGPKWKDELPEGLYAYAQARGHVDSERPIPTRTVRWCRVNATDVLEEREWEGSTIPVVRVIGRRFKIGTDECFKGIISDGKDAQRSLNVMRSAQVEAAGIVPKAPILMAEGQDEGYTDQWDHANTRGYTRLYYRLTDLEGRPAPVPFRSPAEPNIQALLVLGNEASADIDATTGRPTLGLERPRTRVRSGRAQNGLKAEAEDTTSVYLDNLVNVSMTLEARIYLEMLPFVYDRPGRVKRILGDEDQEKTVMLNAPFRPGPQGPEAAPEAPTLLARMGQAVRRVLPGAPPEPTHYDLRKGTYGVVVTIGRSSRTKRDAAEQGMALLSQAAPQLVPLFADLWVDNMDFPGAKAISKRLKQANPAAKDDDPAAAGAPPNPQALAQQIAQLRQHADQLAAALQEATARLSSESVAAERDLALTEMQLKSKERIALLTIKKDLLIVDAELQSQAALKMIDAEIASIDQQIAHLHEQRLLDRTHAHEVATTEAAHRVALSVGVPPR